MKKVLLVGTMIFVLFFCCVQTVNVDGEKKETKIRIIQKYYDGGGNETEECIIELTIENEILKMQRYIVTGGNKNLNMTLCYDYESRKIKKMRQYNGSNILLCYSVYEYDINSVISRDISYDQSDVIYGYGIYDYDADKRLIKYTYYDPSDTKHWYYVNEYNQDGQILKLKNYSSSDVLTSCTVSIYDINKILNKTENYDGSNNLQKYNVYEYNSSGLCIKTSTYDSNGILQSYTIVSQEYF